jgi:tRNA (adenine22-N1)-methyltransferase
MHIRKLIKKRDILIHSISDDNQNDRNRKKKEIALKERELLEGML